MSVLSPPDNEIELECNKSLYLCWINIFISISCWIFFMNWFCNSYYLYCEWLRTLLYIFCLCFIFPSSRLNNIFYFLSNVKFVFMRFSCLFKSMHVMYKRERGEKTNERTELFQPNIEKEELYEGKKNHHIKMYEFRLEFRFGYSCSVCCIRIVQLHWH